MRLVIDIADDFYKGIVDDKYRVHEGRIFDIIRSGTPLLKGKWLPSDIPNSILFKCSNCGFDTGACSFNYCPNCGAKMKEEKNADSN